MKNPAACNAPPYRIIHNAMSRMLSRSSGVLIISSKPSPKPAVSSGTMACATRRVGGDQKSSLPRSACHRINSKAAKAETKATPSQYPAKWSGLIKVDGMGEPGRTQTQCSDDDGHGSQRATVHAGLLHQVTNRVEVFLGPISVHAPTLCCKVKYASKFSTFFD